MVVFYNVGIFIYIYFFETLFFKAEEHTKGNRKSKYKESGQSAEHSLASVYSVN